MTRINKDVVYEEPVMAMAANLRNTFFNICFIALALLSTTNALHNEERERKMLNSEVVNTGSSPSIVMPDATATETSNAVKETLISAPADSRTEHLHNLIELRYPSTDSLWGFHKKSSESSVIRSIYKPVELANEPIETNNWEFRSKRQTEGLGTQTGYKTSVGYETSGVAGVDGTYLYSVRPKRQSSDVGGFGGGPGFGRKAEAVGRKESLIPERAKRQSNSIGGAQSGFVGQVGFEVGGGAAEAGGKELLTVRDKRQTNDFDGMKTGFGGQASFGIDEDAQAGGKQVQAPRTKRQMSSFGAQTSFGANAGFGVGGGAGAGSKGKPLKTERAKRQSNGFGGAQTGFGGRASFGLDGGAGAEAERKEIQTVREKRQSSGFGAQTGFGANAGFGIGAGVGGASGTSEQTYRRGAGFGAQGGFGGTVGFGVGGTTRAAG